MLIEKFYTAFQKRDYDGMIACYHPDIHFSDPVFIDLHGKQAGAMWHMLCERGEDLQIVFSDVVATAVPIGKPLTHSQPGAKSTTSLTLPLSFRMASSSGIRTASICGAGHGWHWGQGVGFWDGVRLFRIGCGKRPLKASTPSLPIIPNINENYPIF